MRILHTSDWHLGRSFHGLSLHDISGDLLAELVQTVKDQHIDVLLVAGDIYDQAQPRTETVSLLSRTLEELSSLECTVILTSGNHDSAIRLGFASKLLAQSGVHVVTSLDAVGEPILVEKRGQRLAVYAIPYLEPRATAAVLEAQANHSGVLGVAVKRASADLATREVTASLVMAHCFATGAEPSESERDIHVGGLDTVPASLFDGFSYAALGHLHGKQTVTDRVRYSGSLLAYSFSEEKHRKGGWLIDVDDDGTIHISEHSWKTTLPLRTLRGKLDDLLNDPRYLAYAESICRIYVTDDQRPLGALEKLREKYSTVAELYFAPEHAVANDERDYRSRISETRSVEEICTGFYTHVRGSDLNETEQKYLKNITDEAQIAEVSA